MKRTARSLAAALAVVAALAAIPTIALADDVAVAAPRLLVGPKVGLAWPPMPTVGLDAKLGSWLGLSFDYGFMPEFRFLEQDVGWSSWSAGARVFPMQGAFFVGAAFGHLTMTAADPPSTGSRPSTRERGMLLLGPEIGWRWISDSGFALGVDLGYGFALRNTDVQGGVDRCPADSGDPECTRVGMPLLGIQLIKYF